MRLRLYWPVLMLALTGVLIVIRSMETAGRPRREFLTPPATGLPFCPQAGAEALKPSDSTGHHKVILSWKATPPPKGSPVGYCIYRSKAKGAAEKNATCSNCEQVNRVPVIDTSCVDDLVEDGAAYFYVVTAIINTGKSSTPSNETPASIPATKQSINPGTTTAYPFCRGTASP